MNPDDDKVVHNVWNFLTGGFHDINNRIFNDNSNDLTIIEKYLKDIEKWKAPEERLAYVASFLHYSHIFSDPTIITGEEAVTLLKLIEPFWGLKKGHIKDKE